MKTLRRLVIAGFALAITSTAAAGAAEEPQSALYSFADLYRLTVSGAGAQDVVFSGASAEPQIRVAAFEPAAAAEPRFTITPVSGPGTGLLLLAGLAAAGWVAHRRLTNAY
jgi:hypothetical protein